MITDAPARSDLPTQPRDAFPLVITDQLDELRAFYLNNLGCTATFDMPNYLQVSVSSRGPGGPQLCFMRDAALGGAPKLQGGFILSVPVPDVDAAERNLREAGIAIQAPASDKPWGWRSLHVVDPAGVVLDFFHVVGQDPEV